MPNYTYNSNVPAASDNPSVSQGQMQTNCNSIASIVDVDLYGFGDNNGGTHQQVTFPLSNVPGAQTNPQGVEYTGPGQASSVVDLKFRNQNGIFLLNCVRAFAYCSGTAGGIIGSQSQNVTSVVRSSAGVYNVTMPAGTVSGSDYIVLISSTIRNASTSFMIPNYGNLTPTTFQVKTVQADSPGGLKDPTNFSFVVLQV